MCKIYGAPAVDNEISHEVLDKVKSLTIETSHDTPDVVIDRAHRIGKDYNDKKSNVSCKSAIVCSLNFMDRTMFYLSRANFKKMLSLSFKI